MNDLEETQQRLDAIGARVEVLNYVRAGLEYLFELSWDLMCITSPEGYFLKLNSAWEQLGWTLDELMSKPYVEFVHPDDRAGTQKQADVMFEGKTLEFDFSNRFVGKDGAIFHLVWRTAQTPDGAGYLFAVARIINVER